MSKSSIITKSLPAGRSGMRAIHPGEILKLEFMEPLKLSGNALATALKVPTNRITELVSGRKGISADTALRLAKYFETSAEFWMNLQRTYELRSVELTTQIAKSLSMIVPRSQQVTKATKVTAKAGPGRSAQRQAS